VTYLREALDFVLNLNDHLSLIIQNFGLWTYLLLFLVIFAETGLVVTPFLPGDSLLFMVGAFSATGSLNVYMAFIVLSIAAIIGDSVNYAIGKSIGPRVFKYNNSRFFKKEHLERTHKFYEKYGAKTIVLARFVPIIRTFAPFVAGVGMMHYTKFLAYNVIGGVAWVALFVFGGFWFGNIPIVKNNFEIVILLIIFVSVLPVIYNWFKYRHENKIITKPSIKVSGERAS
jgi:membrane-associated protein